MTTYAELLQRIPEWLRPEWQAHHPRPLEDILGWVQQETGIAGNGTPSAWHNYAPWWDPTSKRSSYGATVDDMLAWLIAQPNVDSLLVGVSAKECMVELWTHPISRHKAATLREALEAAVRKVADASV